MGERGRKVGKEAFFFALDWPLNMDLTGKLKNTDSEIPSSLFSRVSSSSSGGDFATVRSRLSQGKCFA